MIVQPKIKGFICTTAHPSGCELDVRRQIEYVQGRGAIAGGRERVLVVGSSGGYGLASRIAAAYGYGAKTIGVFLEKEASGKRTASAGWYRARAFDAEAAASGLYARSINGDAFSDEVKAETCDAIATDLGQVDMVVYSLASPVRKLPSTGGLARSAIKPIGEDFKGATIDINTGEIRAISATGATDDEIRDTVAVMGGEDWQLWASALNARGLLAPGALLTNYTYIGSDVTWPIYHHGTIGRAKQDLERAAAELARTLAECEVHLVVMKGLLTTAASAIPGMSVYLSLLFKAMKDKGIHEGCIEQCYRLFATQLATGSSPNTDEEGRIRMDDWEMRPDVQAYVQAHWGTIDGGNLKEVADFAGYREAFLNLYGFGFPEVDYDRDVAV